ncbi:flagellar biosynthesis protein FlhF [Pseudobutyrivibrio sp. YE44]|uniref:flagellar biosynthesis protein FlhF n=1 Tax=Pseudobutyrivibrio sp. YE44 TaxID=1520802 RepID=UPI00088821AA|nr:flagellar biosynthesis protein FlhF [Pseudobutyrivibrio sp. YE44]SDB11090.1 flagellar biosynthesis protein FlhF [Pseudobutyrivibrio sp. YE44]
MTINKYTGKTEEEAMSKVREELGGAAVIMNVKVIKPKGIRGIFRGNTYEVTAAVEDEGFSKDALDFAVPAREEKTSTFDAVADDAIILKDAFSAVNEVLEKQVPTSSDKEANQVLEQPKENNTEEVQNDMTKSNVDFEPLSGSVPRAKILEPIYSKPTSVKPVPKENKENVIPDTKEPVVLPVEAASTEKLSIDNDNHMFVKMLYNVLLDNEVQEKYINQVLGDMDKVLRTSHSLDNLLSSVYQKMVLKLGTPTRIQTGEKKPKVVFFIGPTGVGKTTTIAKIASKFKVEEGKKVGLITADTYRMAAANQLQTYANILGVPLNVIYSAEELLDTVKKQMREYQDLDVILVDTIGFSHRNEEQKADTKKLVTALTGYYESEVYLVLSATTKQKDLFDIANSYMEFTEFNMIFTKLDETKSLGNIFNMKLYTGAPLSYITTGQNVPDDIEIVNAQKLVKQLLGGN